ncbi:uncharacterized protein LY89DRAFT_167207 [Mollisia scopiformis]|uniref:Uncharacterized protein n=1 Tax=Mollisia scopiformis TaxID=149040 RepID=A0A194XTS1_MOLSC|nr:uncharacterized protein LY89DRAFT_167207 [Mollisia scopiformis]KUJ23097.1 hypothetical protein LY89DRAFT_167207 [Mollisia scopiformis]
MDGRGLTSVPGYYIQHGLFKTRALTGRRRTGDPLKSVANFKPLNSQTATHTPTTFDPNLSCDRFPIAHLRFAKTQSSHSPHGTTIAVDRNNSYICAQQPGIFEKRRPRGLCSLAPRSRRGCLSFLFQQHRQVSAPRHQHGVGGWGSSGWPSLTLEDSKQTSPEAENFWGPNLRACGIYSHAIPAKG